MESFQGSFINKIHHWLVNFSWLKPCVDHISDMQCAHGHSINDTVVNLSDPSISLPLSSLLLHPQLRLSGSFLSSMCHSCPPPSASVVNSFADDAVIHYFLPRLGRIDTVYRAEPYEPANLVQYLVRRTKIWQFPLVVSYLCIVTNEKNHPNLVLYLARRTKDVVSILTLTLSCSTWGYTCED